jgi:oxygen-independent coproporphyrinogen-3 oxidase
MNKLTPVALYVHWPWCKAKCPYCDFNSHESTIQEEPYIEGLLKELSHWFNGRTLNGLSVPPFRPETHRITSIFFGGGTPSLMKPDSIRKVIDESRKIGIVDHVTEITVECNPTSFDDVKSAIRFFEDLKAAGVNRVSIGIQGLKAEWLRFLGRTHQVSDALQTLDAALSVFSNVNADVIYGLPDQTVDEWEELLEILIQHDLPHISAYQLTIEKNTRFFADVRRGAWVPISTDLEADFFEATRRILRQHGYVNYEISNFAKPGSVCQHNEHVWKYGEYLGIGAGAHGRVTSDNGTTLATQVTRQPDGYLRRMKGLGDELSIANPLSASEAVQEAIFSGLRLATGVDMEMLLKRFGAASCKEAISASEIAFLVDANFLEWAQVPSPTPSSSDGIPTHPSSHENAVSERHTEFLRLTEQGWPRLNSVLERILAPLSDSHKTTESGHVTSNSEYTSGLTVLIE